MTRERLIRLAQAWRRQIALREILMAAAVGCGAASFFPWPTAFVLFALALATRLIFSRPWKLNAARVAHHLDRTFPALEESSVLWLRPPETLSVVERLQRQRTDAAARILSGSDGDSFAKPPAQLLRGALLCLGFSIMIFAAVSIWRMTGLSASIAVASPPITSAPPENSHSESSTVWPQILHAEMKITPPTYTGRPERTVSGFNAEVEEGSVVEWSVTLDLAVTQPRLIFGGGETDTLALQPDNDGSLRGKRTMSETSLYSVSAMTAGEREWKAAEVHSLKVLKDHAPTLKILQPLLPRTELSAGEPVRKVQVEVLASDDYGVSEAHLVATVAKGTGEAVKFREARLAFDSQDSPNESSGQWRLLKTLDLAALQLEPGDELYFHVEAADNRAPIPNQARSETRFIVLKGANETPAATGASMSGVNLVPEYFRSERQIIIETEKLIADRPGLNGNEFGARSNNLGIDQQLLRQRYGQFLGEGTETAVHSPDDKDDDDAPPPPDESKPATMGQLAAEFGHQHDSQDSATLFDRETKGTMRQAIAAMWEAERFLRAAAPNEALAPENRALAILKELQEADRAYVQRVGFEAAPINFAERRLRGDVSTVPDRALAATTAKIPDAQDSAIRKALRLAPWNNASPETLQTLREIEPAVTEVATKDPERFIDGLQELRARLAGKNGVPNERSQLESALLRMLPSARSEPVRASEASPSMADVYFENLEGKGAGL